jgi:hypothetical protein
VSSAPRQTNPNQRNERKNPHRWLDATHCGMVASL